MQDGADAEVTDYKHLARLLQSVAAEAATLEHSGLQEEDIAFAAEVCAMQLTIWGKKGSLAGQPAKAQAPNSVLAATGSPTLSCKATSASMVETPSRQQPSNKPKAAACSLGISTSTAQQLSPSQICNNQLPHRAADHTQECDSLARALAAAVGFLLHGVLCMQAGMLQTLYAERVFSLINALQNAWPGEPGALEPVLDHLASGLAPQYILATYLLCCTPLVAADSS